jgi:hypothetical protein
LLEPSVSGPLENQYVPPPRTPPRSLEVFLGVTGAMVGAMAVGGKSIFFYSRADLMFNQWAEPLTLLLAVVALIAVAFVIRLPKIVGIVLIAVAVVGLVTVEWYYVPASINLVSAGLLSILRRS